MTTIPICTPKDLRYYSKQKHTEEDIFELQNDIDMSGSWTVRPFFTVEKPLFGTFEGNDYTIKNYRLEPDFSPYVNPGGLFGVSYGVIRNLHVENSKVKGLEHIGGIVGRSFNSIINCSFSGSVIGYGAVGGIVGLSWARGVGFENNSMIAMCSSYGTITGKQSVGGIMGQAGDVNVSVIDCHSAGVITVNYMGGRIIGFNMGHVRNCWATGVARSDRKPLPPNYAEGHNRYIRQFIGYNMGQYIDPWGNIHTSENLDEVVY